MKFSLEVSKDNLEVLKIYEENKNYCIGSLYNQEREIEKFLKQCGEISSNDTYIILGMGSLLAIEKLNEKKLQEGKIIIVEKNEEIFNFMKKKSKYKCLLEKENVFVVQNNEEVKRILEEEIEEVKIEFVKIISFGNYNQRYSNELVDMYKEIKAIILRKKINKNTSLFFQKEWLKGNIYSVNSISTSEKIDNYKNKFKDKPCIIVSAGPSLSKNIDDIDQEKAYIFSGGRTLKPLLNKGMDSDLLTIIDGGEIAFKMVEEILNDTNGALLYNEMTNYNVPKEYTGRKIVSSHAGAIKKMFDYEIEDIIKGGSVANSMAYVAAYMGFDPIIFVGQDLAYTDEKGHAEIAKYNQSSVDGEKYYKKNDVFIEDINGEQIRSSIILNGFRLAMENIIKLFPEIEFIDATEGGAKIEGTKIEKLSEIMKKCEKIKKEKLGKEEENLELDKKVQDYLKTSQKNMKKIIDLCEEGEEKLKKFKLLYYAKKNVGKVDYRLNKIELEIRKYIKDLDLLNSYIYRLIFNLENDNDFIIKENDREKERIEKGLEKNSYLYDGIKQMCKIAINEIENSYKE